ncbi:MAG: FliG C-terminal domain-containing protein [Pseudomonadota bacterium]
MKNLTFIKLLLTSAVALVMLLPLTLTSDVFDKEWELEKLIESRIKKSLSTLMNEDDYYVYVDLMPTQKQFDFDSSYQAPYEPNYDLKDLERNLPGLLGPPGAMMTPEQILPDTFASFSQDGVSEKFIRQVTLILNKEIDSEKISLIRGIITKIAQLNARRGDNLSIKLVDYSLKPEAKEEVVKAPPKQDMQNEQNQKPEGMEKPKTPEETKKPAFMEEYKWLVVTFVILGLLLLFLLLLVLILKNKSPKMRDAQIMFPQGPEQQGSEYTKNMQLPSGQTSVTQAPTPAVSVEQKPVDESIMNINKELVKQEIINLAYGRPEYVANVLENWITEENGLRQAAAIIKSFGLETSMSLLGSVSSLVKNKIFTYYGSVTDWKPQEQMEALDRFNNGLMAQKVATLADSEGASKEHFVFLKKMSDYQIFYLIKNEEPPVIALLLAHLPPDRASKLLAQFEDDKRSKLAVELGNINFVDIKILNAIQRRLAEKSLHIPKFEFTPGMGVNSLISVLDNLDQSLEKNILDSIKQSDPELTDRIRKSYFVYDDIIHLKRDALKNILREVPRTVLSSSMVSADEKIVKAILGILPERKAEMLTFDIEKQRNIAQGEIFKARKEFVKVVRLMIKNGELDLEKALKVAEVKMDSMNPEAKESTETTSVKEKSAFAPNQTGVSPRPGQTGIIQKQAPNVSPTPNARTTTIPRPKQGPGEQASTSTATTKVTHKADGS